MDTQLKRRTVLGLMAGVGASAILAEPARPQPAPAIRRKVTLNYWTWSDSPDHQKLLVTAVDNFNKSQNFIKVVLDASTRVIESQQKIALAFASGGAPDVAGLVPQYVQSFYTSNTISPIADFFQQWDEKSDFYPSAVEQMRMKPGQPLLFLPNAMLGLMLYYRADWYAQAKVAPPQNYDEFIAAAKAISSPPNRYGYALRGADYIGTQPLEAIWGSAGVDFVKSDGTVDFDSPAAQAVTEKWVGMLTRDRSAQPTAVTDSYPQLFSLVSGGKCGMWIYGTHGYATLHGALGDSIQPIASPSLSTQKRTLANLNGNGIISSCPEKEAAWEFIKYMSSGDVALALGPGRGFVPVRRSIADSPLARSNPAIQVVRENADYWWSPPYFSEHWLAYQNGVTPYWQQLLQQQISVADFHARAAALLRGSA